MCGHHECASLADGDGWWANAYFNWHCKLLYPSVDISTAMIVYVANLPISIVLSWGQADRIRMSITVKVAQRDMVIAPFPHCLSCMLKGITILKQELAGCEFHSGEK